MLTRIEIDGFKTFSGFELDLQPFSAVVGPNASGKSNLFDALKFISLLAQHDVRTAMRDLRGEPEELFRQTASGTRDDMKFAVEVLLGSFGIDAFGAKYAIKAQRIRYELGLSIKRDARGNPHGIFISHEMCFPLFRSHDKDTFLRRVKVSYSHRKNAFIDMDIDSNSRVVAFNIRQDGPAGDTGATKRGRPVKIPAAEASRTALSTIATSEFPHLYALRDLLSSIRFLEINPQSARRASDKFESKSLRSDASNLSAVLARLKDETRNDKRPNGVISDIASDLTSLIPSVKSVNVHDDDGSKEYSFSVSMKDDLSFSSRVISDGTLRLLALLSILDDPDRKGVLCFEEPENGVHKGRIPLLMTLLRESASTGDGLLEDQLFQVLVNTHSPAVMKSLEDREIIAADSVAMIDPISSTRSTRTRMRTGVRSDQLELDPEKDLTRTEVEALLRKLSEEA